MSSPNTSTRTARRSATRPAPTTRRSSSCASGSWTTAFPVALPFIATPFHGARDLGDHAPRKPGRAEVRRGACLLTEMPGPMAQKHKVLLASRSADALRSAEREPRERAEPRRFRRVSSATATRTRCTTCTLRRTCSCCASTPKALPSSRRLPSRIRTRALR